MFLAGVGVGSRSRFFKIAGVGVGSRSPVFKNAGVGVGSRSRFFKTAGVGVGSRSRFFNTAGVGVRSRSRNPKKSSDSTTLCVSRDYTRPPPPLSLLFSFFSVGFRTDC